MGFVIMEERENGFWVGECLSLFFNLYDCKVEIVFWEKGVLNGMCYG